MPTDRDIRTRVEELREEFPALRAERLPLDLITFVELDLRLDIIPDDGVLRDFGADAAIMADFTGISVDGETYELIDRAPEWKMNRLRFSLAHQLGHLYLPPHPDACFLEEFLAVVDEDENGCFWG